jgi:hypothetical protein
VVNVACPVPSMVPVPRVVEPRLNVTVPTGIAPVAEVIVAVKVTLCPRVEGLGDEVIVVVVVAFETLSEAEPEELPMYCPLPA